MLCSRSNSTTQRQAYGPLSSAAVDRGGDVTSSSCCEGKRPAALCKRFTCDARAFQTSPLRWGGRSDRWTRQISSIQAGRTIFIIWRRQLLLKLVWLKYSNKQPSEALLWTFPVLQVWQPAALTKVPYSALACWFVPNRWTRNLSVRELC